MQCKPFWRFSASVHMRGRFLWRAPMLCVHPLCCLLSAFKEMSSLVFNFGFFLNYYSHFAAPLCCVLRVIYHDRQHTVARFARQDGVAIARCVFAGSTDNAFFFNILRPPSFRAEHSLSGYCCNLKGKLLCRRIADASAAICLHLVSDASHGVASKLYLENDVIQSPFFC